MPSVTTMDLIIWMIVFFESSFLIFLFLQPRIKEGMKIGFNLFWGKKKLTWHFNQSRGMKPVWVNIEKEHFIVNDELYFTNQNKIMYWLRKIRKRPQPTQPSISKEKRDIKDAEQAQEQKAAYWFSTPVLFYFDNHPSPFDVYEKKISFGISGKLLAAAIRLALLARSGEAMWEWFRKNSWWIILLAVVMMIPMSVGVFYLLKGLGTGLSAPSGQVLLTG